MTCSNPDCFGRYETSKGAGEFFELLSRDESAWGLRDSGTPIKRVFWLCGSCCLLWYMHTIDGNVVLERRKDTIVAAMKKGDPLNYYKAGVELTSALPAHPM